jgi:AraC-like DNA-binding protein
MLPNDSLLHIEEEHFNLSERYPVCVGLDTFQEQRADSPLAMHYELEIGIVLEGRMRRFNPPTQRDLGVGDVWCEGMWEINRFEILECPCRVLVVAIWPPLVAGLYSPIAPNLPWMLPFTCPPEKRPIMSEDVRSEILGMADFFAKYYAKLDVFSLLSTRIRLPELLLLILREYDLDKMEVTRHNPERYKGIATAIDLVFTAQTLVTTAQAADACLMSYNKFISTFKSSMGISFADFAVRHRVYRAATELTSTNDPIKAIAQRWGFTDDSHLHRVFQKYYACSPAEYRTNIRHVIAGE